MMNRENRVQKSVYENNLARERHAEWMTDLKARHPNATNAELMDYALEEYIAFKVDSFKNRKDYGALGDVVEVVCVRALRLSGFRLRDLHTKESGKVDFTSQGKKYEIGHAGKSFNFSENVNLDYAVYNVDFIDSDFFVYGADIKKADVDYIEKNMYVFSAEQAYEMMDVIGGKKSRIRGLFHLTKSNHSMTMQSNNAITNRFNEYVKKNHIPTVREYSYMRLQNSL